MGRQDRSTNPLQGAYVTASRDGQLNWWTLDMTLLRTAYSSSRKYHHCSRTRRHVMTMSTDPDVQLDAAGKGLLLQLLTYPLPPILAES